MHAEMAGACLTHRQSIRGARGFPSVAGMAPEPSMTQEAARGTCPGLPIMCSEHLGLSGLQGYGSAEGASRTRGQGTEAGKPWKAAGTCHRELVRALVRKELSYEN